MCFRNETTEWEARCGTRRAKSRRGSSLTLGKKMMHRIHLCVFVFAVLTGCSKVSTEKDAPPDALAKLIAASGRHIAQKYPSRDFTFLVDEQFLPNLIAAVGTNYRFRGKHAVPVLPYQTSSDSSSYYSVNLRSVKIGPLSALFHVGLSAGTAGGAEYEFKARKVERSWEVVSSRITLYID